MPAHSWRLRLLQEYETERLYRDAPMLLIGEGTAEIQKMIIGRRPLAHFKVR
jgi:alkylation response protein AidB-like acyl-CoA dehydrogenase